MLLSLQKSHQAGEGRQQQALPLKRVPCPGRTEDVMLGASPPRTLPTSLVCPAVPARAVPASGSLSRCANKAQRKGAGRRGDSPGGGCAAGAGARLLPASPLGSASWRGAAAGGGSRAPCSGMYRLSTKAREMGRGTRRPWWMRAARFGVSALVLSLQARGWAARTASAPAACW